MSSRKQHKYTHTLTFSLSLTDRHADRERERKTWRPRFHEAAEGTIGVQDHEVVLDRRQHHLLQPQQLFQLQGPVTYVWHLPRISYRLREDAAGLWCIAGDASHPCLTPSYAFEVCLRFYRLGSLSFELELFNLTSLLRQSLTFLHLLTSLNISTSPHISALLAVLHSSRLQSGHACVRVRVYR